MLMRRLWINMSTPINDGGPAFPHMADLVSSDGNGGINTRQITSGGMSLRDWFAGQALAGLQANGVISENAAEMGKVTKMRDTQWRSVMCYEMADAMLAARAKQGGN